MSILVVVGIFIVTGLCLALIVRARTHSSRSKEGLLAADRRLGAWEASLSIAASWIWAPSLFVSAQKSYQDGFLGLFWFLVPNILCLLLFSVFARRMRDLMPEGFTLSGFILGATSTRVQRLYWVTLVGLSVCAFAVQLLAGGQLLAKTLDIPFFLATVLLAAVPLSYSMFSGLKGAIATDVFKMVLIYVVGFALVPMVFISAGGHQVWLNGLAGKLGTTDFWSSQHLKLFMTFGLPTTIGLLSGPFGDQSFWQRAFAVQKPQVMTAFVRAAFFFALVPLLMSTLGFIAAGAAIPVKDPQLVNLEAVAHFLSPVAAGFFVFMVVVALISTLDTKFTGIASLAGHDFINAAKPNGAVGYADIVKSSRLSMVMLALIALAIANIPSLQILHLFLFYGTLRSSTLLPTILLLLGKPLHEKGVFWGVLASLLIGLPVFSYGNLTKSPPLIVAGSLLTVLLSGAIALIYERARGRQLS